MPRRSPDCRISQIVEGPISFFALCEHHALPFYGVAHIGYREEGSSTWTSFWRGVYEDDPELRRSFLQVAMRER